MSERKFVESFEVEGWSVLGERGFIDVMSTHTTVPYKVYKVSTASGLSLSGADDHILFTDHGEILLKNIKVGDKIKTVAGYDEVTSVIPLCTEETMYDIQVNDHSQSYFTNDILSHNTATASLYLLWYAMFKPDSNILIAAHKGSGADEIMQRIRYAYESCPDYIRCGVTTYAASKMIFDNNSVIEAQTTTENTGRGKSITLLYCLDGNTKVTVKDKNTGEVKEISLQGLYTELVDCELLSIEQTGFYRLLLSNGIALDVPIGYSIYIEDEKHTPDEIIHGDRMNYGEGYVDILDIQYIEDVDEH